METTMNSIKPLTESDVIDLCKRLVGEIGYDTRRDLRLLVFRLSMGCDESPAVRSVLGTMYEWLVAERDWPEPEDGSATTPPREDDYAQKPT
jgi:hypothetical protein